MGYIKLACPVTHVWFSKRIPSYIANPLAKPNLLRNQKAQYIAMRDSIVCVDHYRFAISCHPMQKWEASNLSRYLRSASYNT